MRAPTKIVALRWRDWDVSMPRWPSCDRAIALQPDYAEAHSDRGAALASLGRVEEALAS